MSSISFCTFYDDVFRKEIIYTVLTSYWSYGVNMVLHCVNSKMPVEDSTLSNSAGAMQFDEYLKSIIPITLQVITHTLLQAW